MRGQDISSGTETIVSGAVGRKLDAYLSKIEERGYSGAVIAAKNGEIVLRKGYGYANREKKIPITPDAVFTVGSITKQFTGAAILKLEMQGKLRVGDTIDRYFSDVPDDKKRITIHQLLTHTAGLPDSLGGDFDMTATKDAVKRAAMASKLRWKPGTKHAYSNVGYSLLGMIVEKASGMTYEQFLWKYLFEPADMMHTGYLIPKFDPDTLAIGYRQNKAWGTVLGHPMLEDGPCWHLRANGGIHSTINDLYKWHLALNKTAILSDEAKKKYFAPHVDEGYGDSFYGYGWVNFKTPGGQHFLGHDGGNPFFFADFRRYVEDDSVLVHAMNNTKYAEQVSNRLESILLATN